MATFMDIHSGFVGVTAAQLQEAHERDLAIERDEGVHFERAWLDPSPARSSASPAALSRESGHAHPRARGPSDGRGLRAPGRGVVR